RRSLAAAPLALAAMFAASAWAQPIVELPAAPPREVRDALAAGHGAYMAGRIEDAAADYRYVLALQPDHAEATISLALALKDLGKLPEALPYWVKACLLAPDDSFVWLQRGWTHLGLRDYKEARKAFAKAGEYS